MKNTKGTAAAGLRAEYQRYLEASWELNPDEASALGLEAFNGKLGPNDPDTHRHQGRLALDALRTIESIPGDTLGGDDWLDRRAFLAMLRTEVAFNTDLSRWRTNPEAHANRAIEAVFNLVVRNTGSLKKVLPAIVSRLEALPRFLDEAEGCIKAPVPLWTKLAVQTCEGAEAFFKELEPILHKETTDPTVTGKISIACKNAISAFRRYATAVTRKREGHPASFAAGKSVFEMLLRERTGLDLSPGEVTAVGNNLIDRLIVETDKEAKKFGKGPAHEIIEKLRGEWAPNGSSLLDAYRTTTNSIRDTMVAKEMVSLPRGETLEVLPVPAFLRHSFPTAAYSQPPAYSKKQLGIFWVNDLSLVQTDPKAARSEIQQHFGMELTCAHEAYPGHHLQFFVQNRHPSKVRRLFHHAIFYEGWTLWCEKLCIEQGIYTAPWAKLLQLHDALWRACRIVIDCGIQTGQMSLTQARDLLMRNVGFTKRRAEVDLNWYTSSPTVPLSYLMGRIELERLHRDMVASRGWTLKQFNDWILSFGAVPWNWIRQAASRMEIP